MSTKPHFRSKKKTFKESKVGFQKLNSNQEYLTDSEEEIEFDKYVLSVFFLPFNIFCLQDLGKIRPTPKCDSL